MYTQQGVKPRLNWAELPPVVTWEKRATANVATIFGARFAARLREASLAHERTLALGRLQEVVDLRSDSCLAT